ncbi:MAG: metal ABC transporter permease [Solirubrobacteraceae bacterium MAG38_C4-C5]|nr:metal ABC transporter permease [Candidatus Siliceabacter maunaloa]
MDWLIDPWTSGIMRRAFAEAILMGAVAGGLGCFVLQRGLAFLGESVAHTLIFGVVIAFLLGGPILLGAAGAAALTVALSSALASDRRFSVDVSMGVLLPTFFGLGVTLIALTDGYRTKLEDTLFGAILEVTDVDLALAGAVALLVALTLACAGKELVLATFDRPMARAMGYRLGLLDLLLFALVTLAAVVALRAVGNVLLTAMLLGPALSARLLTRTFWSMAATAAGLGAFAGVVGLYWSWSSNVGGGAAIVLVVAALFAVIASAHALSSAVRPRTPAPVAGGGAGR